MLTQASEPSKNYSLSVNESKHRNEPPAKSHVKQLHMASSQRDNFLTLKKKKVVYNFSAAVVELFPLVFFKILFKECFALLLHLLVITFRQDVDLVQLTLTSTSLSMSWTVGHEFSNKDATCLVYFCLSKVDIYHFSRIITTAIIELCILLKHPLKMSC